MRFRKVTSLRLHFLDIYRDVTFKINKDVNGGFGTGNDFGSSLIGKLISNAEKKSITYPPLYLVSSLSVLASQSHNCTFSTKIIGVDSFLNLIVLSSSIVCCETETASIRMLSANGCKCLVIGPFASQVPHVYLDAGASVLVGEPDTSFANDSNLIHEISNAPAGQVFEPHPGFYPSLDYLPPMRWDLIMSSTNPKMLFLGLGKALPIAASRGCPYSCFSYCTYPLQQGRKTRRFSPEVIVDHIDFYQKKYQVSRFLFRDPVFTLDRQYVIDICNRIIDRGLNIFWAAEFHLKDIDQEIVTLMHRAGLRCVFVGIETINQSSVAETKRFSATQKQQDFAIKSLETAGVSVKAMFIFGMPGDGLQNARKTITYAMKLPVTYLQFSVFTPYPGTPIFETYQDFITTTRHEDFTQWDLVFSHPELTPKDIRHLLDRAYTHAYANPMRLLRILLRICRIQIESLFRH
jgi:anaerobic magnesium-protoporphyrin IX monomethyl ester cyclase